MIFRISLVICSLLILVACEQKADVSEIQTYQKDGMKFDYPLNWDVASDEYIGDVRSVFIETPGSAIFMVQLYPAKSADPLKVYADYFLKDLNVEKLEHSKRTSKSGYIGYFTVSFLGVEVPHQIEFYSNKKSDNVSYLIAQVAIEDFSKVEVGFSLIYDSYQIL